MPDNSVTAPAMITVEGSREEKNIIRIFTMLKAAPKRAASPAFLSEMCIRIAQNGVLANPPFSEPRPGCLPDGVAKAYPHSFAYGGTTFAATHNMSFYMSFSSW
jgi:hypothetical protein